MAMSGTCLRAGSLRLSLAMVLGLLTISAYVVAPILFAQLDSHQAGMIAGAMFYLVNIGVLFLSLAVAMFWFRMKEKSLLLWLPLLFLALLVAANAFILAPHMQALKDAVGVMSELAKDDPQRMQFGILHGISAVCHLLAALLAALLVALGGRTVEKQMAGIHG